MTTQDQEYIYLNTLFTNLIDPIRV